MNVEKTAKAIKDYLVQLAIDDKLPMDMTQLNEFEIEDILRKHDEETPLQKASHILSSDGSDEDLQEMIDLIEAEQDGSIALEDVEGVLVWEALEGYYTVDKFLNEINN